MYKIKNKKNFKKQDLKKKKKRKKKRVIQASETQVPASI